MRSLLLALLTLIACAHPRPALTPSADADAAFEQLERSYVVEFLRRNPTVSTYLGGAGLDPSLAEAEGRLRDYSPRALEEEAAWLAQMQRAFEAAAPLRPALKIDREVALAQLRFLQRQQQVRHHAERALDTYTDEPVRAVDWAMQGFTPTGDGTAGTPTEWALLARRLRAVGPYLAAARAQLELGVKAGRTPDRRMLVRNGLVSCEAEATLGAAFDLQRFHLGYMRQGTIPPGYFRAALLEQLQAPAPQGGRP